MDYTFCFRNTNIRNKPDCIVIIERKLFLVKVKPKLYSLQNSFWKPFLTIYVLHFILHHLFPIEKQFLLST